MNAHSARQQVSVALFLAAVPAFGIVIPSSATGVISGADYNASNYLAPYDTVRNGVNLNGVVYITHGSVFCSGALISATQVLTAAHCINMATSNNPVVNFVDSTNGFVPVNALSYVIDPNFLGNVAGGQISRS